MSTILTWPLLCALGACATPQEPTVAGKTDEPVVHEYKTGSIMATRERRPATEEEKRAAEEMAASIRASQRTPSPRTP